VADAQEKAGCVTPNFVKGDYDEESLVYAHKDYRSESSKLLENGNRKEVQGKISLSKTRGTDHGSGS